MKVLTFGEIMLRLSTGEGERLIRAGSLQMNYGGAEANVAVSLAHFGHDVHYVSKIPAHPIGEAVKHHLRSHGVSTDLILQGGDRLGTYYLESGVGERSAKVIYDRKYSSFSHLSTGEIDWDQTLDGVGLLHVSGITLALSEELRTITLQALQKAKERGITTSFDFNYRASLWSQREASLAYKPLLPYVDITFFGELDAVHLLGLERKDPALPREERLLQYYREMEREYSNIRHMASTFRDVKSSTVNDLQGNYYVHGMLHQSKLHHIDPIVDRVGGGDAFAAGILHGILKGNDPDGIAAFATGASALKHTVRGDSSLFTEEEVRQFIDSGSGTIVR